MSDLESMGVAFHIAGLLIGLSCVVYILIQNRIDKLQKKLYLYMLFILVLNTISEIFVTLITPHRFESAALPDIISFSKYVYFLTHAAMLPLLGYYVLSITGRIISFTPIRHVIFNLPVLAVETLMLTNPLHHQCYYYDKITIEYHRGWGVTLLYVVSAFYIVYFIANLFSSWKAITAKRRVALTYFVSVVVIGIGIQLIFIKLRVELFAEAVAFLGLLLAVEDEANLVDPELGVYNRKALQIDLDNLMANKRRFHIICIKLENADSVRRMTGTSNHTALAATVAAELEKFVKRYNIYYLMPDTFVLTLTRAKKEEAKEKALRISDRFNKSWRYNNVDIILSAATILAGIPDDIDNVEDIFNTADSSLPRGHQKCMIGKDSLGYILRRRTVEDAIQRCIDNNGVITFYQPTVCADSLKVYGAEALMRLHDERLGEIYPDEFIPIAEQIGLIGELDDIVLRQVCRFSASGVPEKLGIRSINVNLSVLQFIHPDIVGHINKIVDGCGADRSRINFEITESVDAADYAKTESVINKMKQSGYRIYMDDYGTGYSNVSALFSMDFDVIKIDKSILWGAEKSEFGMVLLENNVRMFRQMRKGILVEGVENREQTELLQRLGVDFLQGFFFSRPVSENVLVELLENGSL